MSTGEREVLSTVGAQSKGSPSLGIRDSLGWEALARKPSGGSSPHAKELNDQVVTKVGEPEADTCVQPSVAKALGSVRIVGMGDVCLLSLVLDVRWKKVHIQQKRM